MKLLLLLLGLYFSPRATVPLLVLDMDGKKPVQAATGFSLAQYVARSFPIYAADRAVVIDAAEKAARLLDRMPRCESTDTVQANHTRIVVKTWCDKGPQASVRFITQIDELHFLCDFELLRGVDDRRKAQTRLIDFAAYLAQ